jgi:hypothetical protein
MHREGPSEEEVDIPRDAQMDELTGSDRGGDPRSAEADQADTLGHTVVEQHFHALEVPLLTLL